MNAARVAPRKPRITVTDLCLAARETRPHRVTVRASPNGIDHGALRVSGKPVAVAVGLAEDEKDAERRLTSMAYAACESAAPHGMAPSPTTKTARRRIIDALDTIPHYAGGRP